MTHIFASGGNSGEQPNPPHGSFVRVSAVIMILAAGLVPMSVSAYSMENFKKVAPEIAERANEKYGAMINIAALLNDYDEKMILSVMVVESEGKTTAVSHKGAQGLMQLMPATAKAMGAKDPKEPFQNILAGTKYLKEMERVYKFDRGEALVAYNMGPTRAKRWLTEYDPEDSLYVQKVMHVYEVLSKAEDENRRVAEIEENGAETEIVATGILTKPKTLSMLEAQVPLQNLRRSGVVEKE